MLFVSRVRYDAICRTTANLFRLQFYILPTYGLTILHPPFKPHITVATEIFMTAPQQKYFL